MKNLLLALLSGFLLALAWPTYGWPGLLFVAFVPLLFAINNVMLSPKRKKGWRVFGLSYLSLFIFNIITTHWLYYSTVFGMWFAILANTLLMALIWQFYYLISKRLAQLPSLVFLASLWMLFEWLHLHWEFSWPWLNLGNGFATYTGWIQWYEYTGAFGGTLWVWIGNSVLYLALSNYLVCKERKKLFTGLGTFLATVLVPIVISQLILFNYSETNDPIEVVLLQPNINPYSEKYNMTNERTADLLFADAKKSIDSTTKFLIAPETVLAEGYGSDLRRFGRSREKEKAQDFLKEHADLNYLFGVQFYRAYHDKNEIIPSSNFVGTDRAGNPVWMDFFNSAVMLNRSDTSQIYHKSRLVVGVENFPYQSLLKPILGDIMIDLGGTVAMKTTQPERSVFTGTDGTKAAPIICYESIYGAYVTGYVKNGADFLAIITNDAWWGNTQGHKQHLNYARLRAIENRRDVARSANTGISAIIDQTGVIKKQLGYNEEGALKGLINKNKTLTFYSRFGDYIPMIAVFPAIILLVFSFFRKRRS